MKYFTGHTYAFHALIQMAVVQFTIPSIRVYLRDLNWLVLKLTTPNYRSVYFGELFVEMIAKNCKYLCQHFTMTYH